MTWQAIVAARDYQCRRSAGVSAAAQKLVLVMLCDRAAPDGVVFPTSQRQLARWTQLDKRTVLDTLGALVRTGALVVEDAGGPARASTYRLGAWFVPDPEDVRGGGHRPARGGQSPPRGGESPPRNAVDALDADNKALPSAPNPKAASRIAAIRREAIESKLSAEEKARARARAKRAGRK